jgi:phenylacetate-CoA ligase
MLLRTLYYFYSLKRNLSLSLSDLQEIQRKSLRRIVRYAYENVPLYHRKFDQAGVKPGDIRSVRDLSRYP